MASIVNRTNYSFLDILPELGEFVRNDSYSLLIKGRSGTGKTTLSLSILRSLKARNNFFYISTRSSPKQLFEHYPWLRKFTKSCVFKDEKLFSGSIITMVKINSILYFKVLKTQV